MTLVVGTDFSTGSQRAASTAAALAERLGQPLVLLHVVTGPFASRSVEHSGKRARRALERLEREVAAMARPGLEVGARLGAGAPDAVLANAAESLDASLLVVSATGRGSAGRWLLGSVAERALQQSARPVLVVRDGEPLQRWARGREPLHLMLATDLASGTLPALAWAADWLARGDCTLTLVHAIWPPDEHRRLGLTEAGADLFPLAHENLQRRMLEWAGDLSGRVRCRVISGVGRIGDLLVEVAAEERAHVVFLGTRRLASVERYWEGSVARRLVHLAPADVVCVPASAEQEIPAPVRRLSRLLVATDLTPHGNRALAYAVSLLPQGGSIDLVHVVNETSDPHIRSRLEALAASVTRKDVEIRVDTPFSADPARAICQEVLRRGAEAVCMAAHRRGSLARVLKDSISRRLVDESPVPILLVPARSGRGGSWLGAGPRSGP